MKLLQPQKSTIGKRGTVVISAPFREEYGLNDGQDVIQEPTPEGVLIRASTSVPIRRYTDAEKAAFILNGALTPEEYTEAVAEIKAMGLDPRKIPHRRSK